MTSVHRSWIALASGVAVLTIATAVAPGAARP